MALAERAKKDWDKTKRSTAVSFPVGRNVHAGTRKG